MKLLLTMFWAALLATPAFAQSGTWLGRGGPTAREAPRMFPQHAERRLNVEWWNSTRTLAVDGQGGRFGVTMAGYNAIEYGMTKAQIDDLLGFVGTMQDGFQEFTTYYWQDGFGVILATFTNGMVTSTAQSGL